MTDLGFVGEPKSVDIKLINTLISDGFIPVIAPVGYGEDGETYNVNADTAAGAIAGATGAQRMLMLTDVEGVLAKDGKLIPELTINEANKLQKEGVISGAMNPKVATCNEAVKKGAEAAVILDGRVPHAVLLELFTSQGHGTIIRDN